MSKSCPICQMEMRKSFKKSLDTYFCRHIKKFSFQDGETEICTDCCKEIPLWFKAPPTLEQAKANHDNAMLESETFHSAWDAV